MCRFNYFAQSLTCLTRNSHWYRKYTIHIEWDMDVVNHFLGFEFWEFGQCMALLFGILVKIFLLLKNQPFELCLV